MKIEIRRNENESWFLLCYAGSLVEAVTVSNKKHSQGYLVRISNSQTGFVIKEK